MEVIRTRTAAHGYRVLWHAEERWFNYITSVDSNEDGPHDCAGYNDQDGHIHLYQVRDDDTGVLVRSIAM